MIEPFWICAGPSFNFPMCLSNVKIFVQNIFFISYLEPVTNVTERWKQIINSLKLWGTKSGELDEEQSQIVYQPTAFSFLPLSTLDKRNQNKEIMDLCNDPCFKNMIFSSSLGNKVLCWSLKVKNLPENRLIIIARGFVSVPFNFDVNGSSVVFCQLFCFSNFIKI